MEETAAVLRGLYGIQVRTTPDAAHSHTGRFLDADLPTCLRILDTNCRAPLALVHHFGGRMAARGRGGILVMSSLSAFWGSPYVAVYGATKAFLVNLSEALWRELGASGVDVTVCTAGPVLTPNYIASMPRRTGPSALEMAPERVAAIALGALGRKHLVVPGVLNCLARFFLGRFVSRRTAVSLLERNTERMYGS